MNSEIENTNCTKVDEVDKLFKDATRLERRETDRRASAKVKQNLNEKYVVN